MAKKIQKTPQKRAPKKSNNFTKYLFLALCGLAGFTLWMPWSPLPVGLDLDPSWRWALHEAWLQNMSFGKDIVFTFGPYGFLFTDIYHPATYGLMLAFYAGLIAVFILVMWRVFLAMGNRPGIAALWLAMFLVSVCLWDVSQTLPFHLCFALWAWYWHINGGLADRISQSLPKGAARISSFQETVLLHCLVAALAFISLVKFTSLTMTLGPVLSVVVYEIWKKRQFPWILVTMLVSGMFFWLIAGQSIAGLWPYIRNSVEIAAGFNQAMAMDGPVSEIILYIGAAAFLVVFTMWLQWKQRGWIALLPVAALGCMLFALFKIAFVRHDAHALTAAPVLLPWSLTVLASSMAGSKAFFHRAASAVCLIGALIYAQTVVKQYFGRSLPETVAGVLTQIPSHATNMGRVLAGGNHMQRHRDAIESIRRVEAVPPLTDRVDVYPVSASLALANGLKYSPRPVLQSYSAYSPALSRMNAEYISGGAGPEHLLFAVDPIDQRFPALEDSLSWPELMIRYTLQGRTAGHLILRKLDHPAHHAIKSLAKGQYRIGEWARLPNAGAGTMIWATLHFKPTFRGRIATLLFKPPTMIVVTRLKSGETAAFRMLPGVASAGFLLSPLITTTEEFGELLLKSGGNSQPLRTVESILITGNKGQDIRWAFESEFQAEWYTLQIEGGPAFNGGKLNLGAK